MQGKRLVFALLAVMTLAPPIWGGLQRIELKVQGMT